VTADQATLAQPLAGMLVIDASRMMPGAVLARNLIDLGARVIKVEDPVVGDPMRLTPPLVGGIGVGFCVYYRGAESLRLDLRTSKGMDRLRGLLARADVFVESFRPGTLARWGLRLDRSEAPSEPRAADEQVEPAPTGQADDVEGVPTQLVSCSLPAFGDDDKRVAHDLNVVGLTGLLGQLPKHLLSHGSGNDIPRMLIGDVLTGLLATSSVLAALLARARSGRGQHIHQTMLGAPLPLLTWAWADRAAGGGGMLETALAGRVPCYRCYRCADGLLISVGCLEPKFWASLCEALERPQYAALGLDLGERGRAAADAIAELFASQAREHWLRVLGDKDLPVAAVHDLDAARSETILASAGLLERTPMPNGGTLSVPGPALAALGRTPSRPAPRLGEHDASLFAEFGIT
jgi:crotonobetainyl-CoA:carnitine CoA-transferase CaiB-like acyl-CoA transferase